MSWATVNKPLHDQQAVGERSGDATRKTSKQSTLAIIYLPEVYKDVLLCAKARKACHKTSLSLSRVVWKQGVRLMHQIKHKSEQPKDIFGVIWDLNFRSNPLRD
ncbi:hypothetical protein TNCT_551931 [Trichonephila clavata]|uniref:Uncharacterized protein n=1 Tax=Trichonephila clavata TaxID=2740835 RepID=A0A8X6LKF2_TRICU|nr:hypothetical protein TNCT_551931 [Trichonephila clavata]